MIMLALYMGLRAAKLIALKKNKTMENQMKTIYALLALLVMTSIAQAHHLDNKRLLSMMNYGMPALMVKNIDKNKVEVIVTDAILFYADNEVMLDPVLINKLLKTFKLNNSNALVLTFAHVGWL